MRRDRLGTSTVRHPSTQFKDKHYLCYILPFFCFSFVPISVSVRCFFLSKLCLMYRTAAFLNYFRDMMALAFIVLISFNDVCRAKKNPNSSWCDKLETTSRQWKEALTSDKHLKWIVSWRSVIRRYRTLRTLCYRQANQPSFSFAFLSCCPLHRRRRNFVKRKQNQRLQLPNMAFLLLCVRKWDLWADLICDAYRHRGMLN